MKKEEIYLNEEGIDFKDVNNVIRMINNCIIVEGMNEKLNFITSEEVLLGCNENKHTVTTGMTKEELSRLLDKSKLRSKLRFLVNWIHDAEYVRINALDDLQQLSLETYCEMNNIECPKPVQIEEPLTELDNELIFTENEYIKYEELNYQLEIIDELISDVLSAKDKLHTMFKHSYEFVPLNNNIIGKNYYPSISEDKVINKYNELLQSKLDIENQLKEFEFKKNRLIKESKFEYNTKLIENDKNYDSVMSMIKSAWMDYKFKEKERIMSLKIRIPDSVKEIYNRIINLK